MSQEIDYAAGQIYVAAGRLAVGIVPFINQQLVVDPEAEAVVAGDVAEFLRTTGDDYDVVFVDPPYALELASVSEILKLVADRIPVGGTVVLHRPDGEQRPEEPRGLTEVDDRRYGGTRLRRYERKKP